MLKRALVVATFWIIAAPAVLAAEPPAPDQLTQKSADQWYAGAAGAAASVYDDAARFYVDGAALRFETTGCFDTWLGTPATQNAAWDFIGAGSGGMAFWLYSENTNIGFQGPSPWVRLYTTDYDYIEFTSNRDYCGEARGQWVYVTVPFNGDSTWTRTVVGAGDLANINYIEIHADTWDCNFKLWIDGLNFGVSYAPPGGLLAVAGNARVDLSWDPYNDTLGNFSHYALYRSTAPFTNVTGMTPIGTRAGINNTTFADTTALNGVHYHYAVTALFVGGGETKQVTSVGPRTPRNETDLQVTCIARTPRYPRYAAQYTYYSVTEPSGFGPYVFSAATGLGAGQTEDTQRWPALNEPVTYIATVRNRGTNAWSGTLAGRWLVDGVVATAPSQPANLAPGATTTFAFVLPWDNTWHEVRFELLVSDARPDNNGRSIWTKSAPFLTYVDLGFLEQYREETTKYPSAVTDDLVDWLQRHADTMNQMFADAGSIKRVHYDVLEVLDDHAPDPSLSTIYFGVFPYRYRGGQWGEPRSSGYYNAAVDTDFGLCHELSHQLGLIDIYRLNLGAGGNQVSSQGYSAVACLMHGCSPFYSAQSAGGMTQWGEIVHGYYGQYLYDLPQTVRMRFLGFDGQPLPGATVTMYQACERPGLGQVLTTQAKALGTTDPNGIWTLPNVPIDPQLVPPTDAGVLHDNPFGYVAVVGTNGLLHFKIEYQDFVDYCWLDITECNVAYWSGQMQEATFDRPLSIGGSLQLFPPADMTELNAINWTAWAQDGTVTLSDNTARVHNGTASLLGVFTGGFDNYVRYPTGLLARWDLSQVTALRMWIWSENPNFSYQSQSPWVRLGSFQDGYFQWTPAYDILNQAQNRWYEFVVPLAGNGTWARSTFGTPTLSHINYLQIHADTWGYGFDLWFDGVRFDPQPVPAPGDLNCDGAMDFKDINPFVLALSDPSGYANRYPGCPIAAGDINEDGTVDFRDINPFVALLTGD